MKHVIICGEYPPAPGGGIGTYVFHIARLLAESGETIHVIGELWAGAEKEVEEQCAGRLIIHRVPVRDWAAFFGPKPSAALKSQAGRGLFDSGFPPQCFSWQASLLAERLVEREGIDVIEAQEFEAPLYYFQLRRALGLGPKKQPPCLVHLHSPMELIVQHNDWEIGKPAFLTAKRLEDYSVAAADALLCPSQYLARQAEAHYGLAAGSIQVIPLPIGDNPLLERSQATWEQGTICYVGRLERRKGVLEWLAAAVAVADEYPMARFEFIGANILGPTRLCGEEIVERLIPKHLRPRFLFRGAQKRTALPQFLAGARMAVVPSRWENFPNTCVEAMCSGLPVIASRQGGMAEMIEDGHTGWLASKAGSTGLAEALRRALETPPGQIAAMGCAASAMIRQLCDNKKIVEHHLRFRSHVVHQGAKGSLHLPGNLPWAKQLLADTSARRTARHSCRQGLAVVVTGCNTGQSLHACLQSLARQTHAPVAVAVLATGVAEEQALQALYRVQGWHIMRHQGLDPVAAKNVGIEVVLKSGLHPLGFAFLSAADQLAPHFVAVCESILQQCPEVGIVSGWVQCAGDYEHIWIRPCPGFPYQWLSNDAAPFSAVRTEALSEAGKFRPELPQGYEDWDLCNAIMAAGWTAVTAPEILGSRRTDRNAALPFMGPYTNGSMRRELLERFTGLIARDATELVLLTAGNTLQSWREEHGKPERLAIIRSALYHPRGTALRILGKVKDRILRLISV
jgi:glycosyltransferase involved in cell wall biosynthesis